MAACVGALVVAVPASAAAPAVSGRLLVGFEKGVSKERQQNILAATGGRIGRRFSGGIRGGRLAAVRPRSGKATDALRKRLRRTDGVAYADPELAKLVAVKFMNSKGKGSTSDAIDGIDYAVKNGAKIINCSFGSSSKSSALHDSVDYAQDHNALLVVAAGNDGENIDKNPVYPASYTDSNILTVAASTDTDTLASFSNFGSTAVDVAAPGDNIFSTYLGGGYKYLSGTSMAAPYAAGTAALLRKQESDATYGELRKAIRQKVDKPPALNGKVAYDGRLNVQKALAAIPGLVD